MKDKELETMIHTYFENEVPEPNQQLLDDLKTQMHQPPKTSPKRSYNKFRIVLVSCILMILILPAMTLPFVWDNLFPADVSPEEEIYYSDSNLTMVDISEETLRGILVGEFSKYAALIEDYTINAARCYYAENDVPVYLDVDMDKNDIPYTQAELNIVFVDNYEHELNRHFEDVAEFQQYEKCKLYESTLNVGFEKQYYKLFDFESHKVYLQLDKQDSSIINAIVQN